MNSRDPTVGPMETTPGNEPVSRQVRLVNRSPRPVTFQLSDEKVAMGWDEEISWVQTDGIMDGYGQAMDSYG